MGNCIATWDQTSNILWVGDCGWKSRLTFRRLNTILSKLNLYIHSVRGVGYVWDVTRNIEYHWKGTHIINVASSELLSRVLRKTLPRLSCALRNYYHLALTTLAKQKQLVTQTLDSTTILFPKQHCNHHFKMPTLVLYQKEGALKAYVADVACSKIYVAFMKNNATPITNYLTTTDEELCGSEILTALKEYNVDLDALPANVGQQVCLLKLLEA